MARSLAVALSVILVGWLMLMASGVTAGGVAKALEATEVADGVFVHHGTVEVLGPSNEGDVANLSFVVGDKCIAVIDTGSTKNVGERLRATIAANSDKPVCYVINTHAHPDHVLGNVAFRGGQTQFVGHKNLTAAFATRGPIYLRAIKRDLPQTAQGTELVPPDIVVTDELELELGGRKLTVRAWPTSHTDADVTVFDKKTATLWLGDLSFVGHLPVVDGNLKGWLRTINELKKIPAKRAVPGHGAFDKPGWPANFDQQTAYLTGLRDDVRKEIADGTTLSKALETVNTGKSDGWLVYDEFHKRNVSAAYAELEWE